MNTQFNFEWFEDLPENCPPNEARVPRSEAYYRLTRSFPPSIEDFYCQKRLFPEREHNANECIIRAVSLQKTAKACEKLKKFPLFKDKIVVKIILNETCGVILRTSKKHFSWWMSSNFNPIANCELI